MDANPVLQILASLGGSAYMVGLLIMLIFTLVPGPMNAIIITQVARKGIKSGVKLAFANVLGSMTAVFLGSLPFLFGVTFFVNWLTANMSTASLITGCLLLAAGLFMFFNKPKANSKPLPMGRWYILLGYFAYTALNPGNVLTDAALVTLLQAIGTIHQPMDVVMLMLGFATGGAIGWAIYLFVISRLRLNKSGKFVRVLNRILGALVTVTGIFLIVDTLITLLT